MISQRLIKELIPVVYKKSVIENISFERYFYDIDNNIYLSGASPSAPFDGYKITFKVTDDSESMNIFLDLDRKKKLERKIKLDDLMDEDICPICGNYENLHYNYDYSMIDMPIIDIVCNECGHRFFPKINEA